MIYRQVDHPITTMALSDVVIKVWKRAIGDQDQWCAMAEQFYAERMGWA